MKQLLSKSWIIQSLILFIVLFIRITLPFEYDDDDDVEKQIASQSCKY
jgi:hypothetical protein